MSETRNGQKRDFAEQVAEEISSTKLEPPKIKKPDIPDIREVETKKPPEKRDSQFAGVPYAIAYSARKEG